MRVVYAPEAIRDLHRIKESIVEKFSDTNLAIEVIRDITNNIRNLEIFPKMGQVIVHISRVLNEKQEFMRILYGITEE